MIQPDDNVMVRPVDQRFVSTLKEEFMSHQALCPPPLVCHVESIDHIKDFIPGKVYRYQTIGGNHRRCAAQQLTEEGYFDEHKTLSAKLVFGKYIFCFNLTRNLLHVCFFL